MRGDSLRDLYAKVIAVVGLGVLAGAGALVDYWPSAACRASLLRSAAPPWLLRFRCRPARPLSFLVRVLRTARLRSLGVETEAVARGDSRSEHLGLSAGVAPDRFDQIQRSGAGRATGCDAAVRGDVSAEPHDAPVTDVTDNAFMNCRFLGGVGLGRRRRRIHRRRRKPATPSSPHSRKTGASIFDAFRFVGGAMKKALPGT